MRRTLIDPDKLTNADRTRVANLCVTLFNTLQPARPADAILALAAAFVLMCRAAKASVQDTFVAATNLMYDRKHADRMEHRFAAMEYHLTEDLLKGRLG